MRVLCNAAFDTRAPGGIAQYLRRIVPELARHCELTVLSPDPEQFAPWCRALPIPEWTRSHHGRVYWALGPLASRCSGQFDALFCPTPLVPTVARLPRLAVVHDLTPLILAQDHGWPHRALFLLQLQTLRRAEGIIAVSQNTRRDLVAHLGAAVAGRTRVVYEGPGVVPSDSARDFGADLEPFVLYVGGHAPHKNVQRLIGAFARLRQPNPWTLVIVGGGAARHIAETHAAIRASGLVDRVRVLERLSDAQVSSLYRRCCAAVYPSRYEGFGLPALEAMAHGAPLICSDASSLPEVGGDAALYFDPGSEQALTRQLQRVLDQPALAAELRAAGLARAAQFSWARAAHQIAEELSRVATGRVTWP